MMHVGFARVIWAEYIAPILLLDAAMQQRGMDMQGATVGATLRGRPSVETRCGNLGRPRRAAPTIRLMRRVLLLIIVLVLARTTSAHEGPPFPLFVDQKVDRYVVSLWSDPDVGDALF